MTDGESKATVIRILASLRKEDQGDAYHRDKRVKKQSEMKNSVTEIRNNKCNDQTMQRTQGWKKQRHKKATYKIK